MKGKCGKRDRQRLLGKNEMQSFIFLFASFLSVFICVHLWFPYLSLWFFYAPRRERIARAASFARSPRSPTGPTHEGQPFSHGHAAISSRVLESSKVCVL